MNKKEIAELKKHFSDSDSLFTLNSVVTAFVDPEKNIKSKTIQSYHTIPEEEGSVMLGTLSKVLSGALGKGLLEYNFPSEEYEEGKSQNLLYNCLKDKLSVEGSVDNLLAQIVNNLAYEPAYSIIIGHCTYTAFSRDKNDERGYDGNDYSFLVGAICPANTRDDGLMYDFNSEKIVKKNNFELIISRDHTDGFLFPTFTDRSADINSVMYSTKSPKKPNVSFVNDVLRCSFSMSANREKQEFCNLVSDIAREELDYTVITTVNEILEEYVVNSKNEPELPVVDDKKMYEVLSEAGVSEEKLEALPEVYKERIGENNFKATNLVVPKTTLVTADVKVIVGKNATDKVRTAVIEGRKCLIIDLEDPSVEINGVDTKIS